MGKEGGAWTDAQRKAPTLGDFSSSREVLQRLIHRWADGDPLGLEQLCVDRRLEAALLLDHQQLVERSLARIAYRAAYEAREELDDDIGELKARLVLDFLWKEAAPAAYNQGVSDAQAWLAERLSDLEGSVHADDAGYWAKR